MRHASFSVEFDGKEALILRDLGPWSEYPTITNDAEWVVEQVAPALAGRALFYVDSLGELTRLVVKNNRFAGFSPVSPHVDLTRR